jgi:hypothetical protein
MDHKAAAEKAAHDKAVADKAAAEKAYDAKVAAENKAKHGGLGSANSTSEPRPDQRHSGPYDHLTDAIPDILSHEKVWILLGPTGEPISVQREVPAYGVPAIRGRVNDLYDNTMHHLTTESGAELTASMQPHPEFRLPPAEEPPPEGGVLAGKKHGDNDDAKAHGKK